MKSFQFFVLALVLVLGAVSFVQPVHAVGFSANLSVGSIVTSFGSMVTDQVTVTNLDASNHTISFTISGGSSYYGGYSYSWASTAWFSPSQVFLKPSIPSASSTLTISIPREGDYCPTQSSSLASSNTLTITATDLLTSQYVTMQLVVSVNPPASLSVQVQPSKAAYEIGENVVLSLNSNQAAQYTMAITDSSGATWTSMSGSFPGTFTKMAAEPLGTYAVSVTAHYCGTVQASASFQVVPNTYDVTVNVAGLPSGVLTVLSVDGGKVAELGSSTRGFSYPIGSTHIFQVDQYVNGLQGYRYYSGSNVWTATTGSSNTFAYVTEVYLTVGTNPSNIVDVSQSAWYSQGASASIASVPTEVLSGSGTKYVFRSWLVDGSSRSSNGFSVTMDAPHTVIARYDTAYYLTVQSQYGNPQGEGWYAAGTTAVFSVTSPVGFGVQEVFGGWQGDYTGFSATGSITMNTAKTVIASWRTSYFGAYMLIMGAAIAVFALIFALRFTQGFRSTISVSKDHAAQTTFLPTTPRALPASSREIQMEKRTQDRRDSDAQRALDQKDSDAHERHCEHCGERLSDSALYCSRCGAERPPIP